jgi:hypothetical protein
MTHFGFRASAAAGRPHDRRGIIGIGSPLRLCVMAKTARPVALFVAGVGRAEPPSDPAHQLIADFAIGVESLLAVALDDGGIGGRPIFDVEGELAAEVQRLVVGPP